MKTQPDALDRYLATVNRLDAERRKKKEDEKLKNMKRQPWWKEKDE